MPKNIIIGVLALALAVIGALAIVSAQSSTADVEVRIWQSTSNGKVYWSARAAGGSWSELGTNLASSPETNKSGSFRYEDFVIAVPLTSSPVQIDVDSAPLRIAIGEHIEGKYLEGGVLSTFEADEYDLEVWYDLGNGRFTGECGNRDILIAGEAGEMWCEDAPLSRITAVKAVYEGTDHETRDDVHYRCEEYSGYAEGDWQSRRWACVPLD